MGQLARSGNRRLPRLRALVGPFALAGVMLFAGCGDDNASDSAAASTPAATTADDGVDFAPIKTYLLDHTQRLTTATAALSTEAQTYFDLAKSVDFDGTKLLADHREDVASSVAATRPSPLTLSTMPVRLAVKIGLFASAGVGGGVGVGSSSTSFVQPVEATISEPTVRRASVRSSRITIRG